MGMMGAAGGGGGGGQIDTDVDGAVNKANGYLQDALLLGLPYSERFTQQAVDAVERNSKQARIDQEGGFQRAQGLQAPYRLAGYQALDSYLDTLTLARPEMGSYKLATALEATAKRDQALQQLGMDVNDVMDYNSMSGMGEISGGKATPWRYAENMLAMSQDMARNNYYPTSNYASGYQPLDQVTGGYMPEGSYMGSSADSSIKGPPPTSASGINDRTIRDLSTALGDYGMSTQYYTPELGGIAASFNSGMLGAPVWTDVGV